MKNDINKIAIIIASVAFGTFLVFFALGILIIHQNIGEELFFGVRLLLALGSGFVSAGITGDIHLETTECIDNKFKAFDNIGKVIIKAGGPIAITILVWITTPDVF